MEREETIQNAQQTRLKNIGNKHAIRNDPEGMSYFVEGVRFYAPIQLASRQLPGHFLLQVPEPQRMSGSRATLQSLHGYEQISQHTAWSQSR